MLSLAIRMVFELLAVFSLASHLFAWWRVPIVGDNLAAGLFLAVLVGGWITALAARRFDARQSIGFKEAYREKLPAMARAGVVVLFVYAGLTVLVSVILMLAGSKAHDPVIGRALAIQVFSTGWLLFFYVYALVWRVIAGFQRDGKN